MEPISLPANPADGQVAVVDGKKYVWRDRYTSWFFIDEPPELPVPPLLRIPLPREV